MTMQQYCLRWNNHQPNFISVFSSLLNSESLVDVTLAAEGKHLQAHKVVLSACSSYFQSLFTINPCQHPIVILKDVKFLDLKVMVDFMYYGEVNVSQEQLPYILKTAEMLKIKGLAEIPVEQTLSKTHSTSMEKTELHAGQESNWSDGVPMQSSTPSPCPLSPSSRRKRLRKLSSGSGSADRPDQLEAPGNELLLSQNVGNILGSVIKTDPGGYSSDSSNLGHKTKQHSGESDLQRGSSHESGESDTLHQITLQVPQHQQQEIGHGLEADPPNEIPGSSVTSQQQSAIGLQWNMVDQNYYSSCGTPQVPDQLANGGASQCHMAGGSTPQSPEEAGYVAQISNSPPQILQKRKRSLNPQGEENFIKALDAVRFGGIGFCKAARMYGVNNRTLWLEYKKRGYPNYRLSIKNRKQEQAQVEQQPAASQSDQIYVKQQEAAYVNAKPAEAQNKATVDQILQQNQPPMGTKRGRFLMRQPRVKRESDSSQPSEGDSACLHYLNVPHSARVERQYSDPLPTISPPPGNLLAVPGAVLVKQHSHPLLPSQIHQPLSPPLHVQLLPHAESSAERAVSPVVVVSNTPFGELPRADSAETGDVRSSHCPVSRPGPALGCNYCWNTVDNHGRILRRKTKYHCPECQTNLCIVPCFQEYHKRHSISQADPSNLTSSVMKMFPKTSSM